MSKNEKASMSVLKIILVCLVLIFAFNIVTRAAKVEVKDVLSNEQTINITEDDKNEEEVIELSESSSEVSKDDVIDNYASIVEKIVIEEETIPFETITKDVSNNAKDTTNKVIQEGKDGLKKITYKIKYQNDEEIEKTKISEEIVKKPVDKIVQVNAKATVRSGLSRAATSGSKAEYQAYAKERCADYGWSDYDFDCLVALWNRESRWTVNACNSYSGAYGIPQSLPASKMASAGSDYLTNYKTQINWGLSYISSRYGSPSAAWAHSERTGWY